MTKEKNRNVWSIYYLLLVTWWTKELKTKSGLYNIDFQVAASYVVIAMLTVTELVLLLSGELSKLIWSTLHYDRQGGQGRSKLNIEQQTEY